MKSRDHGSVSRKKLDFVCLLLSIIPRLPKITRFKIVRSAEAYQTLTFYFFCYLIQWKPLKMMKNAFYFILKDKIYDITTCLTNNYNTHINNHISRSKSNQTIKLGQLIEYHKRNIFLYSSRPLFIIFNSWKVQWNWIAFSQNSFVISPGLLHHVSPD